MVVAKSKSKTDSSIVERPPVVCVLGHVDHGKTTLLDYIRKTKVASQESGGITQHIGAYQVTVRPTGEPSSRAIRQLAESREIPSGNKKILRQAQDDRTQDSTITFIDTPGHAAFSKLRSRGAQATDLAVLVIDAKEGIKPQTIECLQHIKQAKIPFLVAINKMDLPDASPEMVKNQLSGKGVLVEGYGGDVVCVPISAKTGEGIEDLLEMIVLLAQMQDLKADLGAPLQAIVIETKLDCRKGPMATLLVKNGVLKVGDFLIAEDTEAKIKAMFDENGNKILQAFPSKPVEALGFKEVPKVGSRVRVIGGRLDRKRSYKKRMDTGSLKAQRVTEGTEISAPSISSVPSVIREVSEIQEKEGEENKLKVILKADTFGSLEAIKDSFPEEVLLISEGIGEVTGSDVLLAASTSALILAFRVEIPAQVQKLVAFEKVKIRTYDIIYYLIEDIEKAVLKVIEPEIEEEVLGEAKVIAEFKMKANHIAGCKVEKGKISKKDLVHVKRDKKLVSDARIKSLQKKRQDAENGKPGEEIGVVFSPDVAFAIGDDIISYKQSTLRQPA